MAKPDRPNPMTTTAFDRILAENKTAWRAAAIMGVLFLLALFGVFRGKNQACESIEKAEAELRRAGVAPLYVFPFTPGPDPMTNAAGHIQQAWHDCFSEPAPNSDAP